jgi:hypothetical protein
MRKFSPEDEYGLSKRSALGLLLGGSAVVLLLGLAIGYTYTTGHLPGFGASGDESARAVERARSVPPTWVAATPTPAQIATLAGGREVTWLQQGMSWTLPADFVEAQVNETSAWYQDAAGTVAVVAHANPIEYAFEAEPYLESFYSQHRSRRKSGAIDDLRYLEIDGVKGVVVRECATQNPQTPRKLQWTAFRDFGGKKQSIAITITAPGGEFATREDVIYAILYSARIPH